MELNVHWLNRKGSAGEDLTFSIPVSKGDTLSSLLELIFDKTSSMEQSLNPQFIPCHFSPEYIQLIRNESLLCPEEFHVPIEYFMEEGPVPVFLNSRHCGSLLIFAKNYSEDAENPPLHLYFDLGHETTMDLKKSLEKELGTPVDYIFTDSTLLVHPGMKENKEMLRDHLNQCDYVNFKMKSSVYEIGLTVQIQLENDLTESTILFPSCKMRVKVLKEEIKSQFINIQIDSMDMYYGERELTEAEMEGTLESCLFQDGGVIRFLTQRSTMYDAYSFPDVTNEHELIPIEKGKWNKPEIGLNFLAICDNEDCTLGANGASQMVHWKKNLFDLVEDPPALTCPKCKRVLNIQTPAFHMTQWKYYGRKSKNQATSPNDEIEPTDSILEFSKMETQTGNSKVLVVQDGSNSKRKVEVLTCDWQTADEAGSYTGFTIVDTPGIQIGLTEWETLVLLTRPLSLSKQKMRPKERVNFGLDIAVPLMFSVSFKFDWFRDAPN